MDDDFLKPGGALSGCLFARLLAAFPAAREAAPGDRFGPFRIVRELGRGGMAVVYLADRADGEVEQRVALKLVQSGAESPVTKELFRQERQILATLDHPGIARFIDAGRSAHGTLWVAMELVEGQRIDRFVCARQLDQRARLELFLQVCAAVGFAHQRLIIHHDIKPSNILVTADACTKLLDFGIAALADTARSAPSAMTPGWASPEQKRGEPATTTSDIFQLGLLLERLLAATGWTPRASTVMTGTHVHSDAPTPTVPEVGVAIRDFDLRAIIAMATAPNPVERYASAALLAADVRAMLARQPVAARNGNALYRGQRFLARHPLAAAMSLAVLMALAILGWRLALERDVARQQAAHATALAVRANHEAQRAQAGLSFLSELLGTAQPAVHRGRVPTVADLLDSGAAQLSAASDSPIRGELLATLGGIRIERGEFAQANALLEQALPLLRASQVRGRTLADALGNLAYSLDYAESDRALLLFDEALTLLAADPVDAEQRLRFERLRASVLFGTGAYRAAEIALTRIIAQSSALVGDGHTETANAQVILAMTLSELDREDEALTLVAAAYRSLERALGPDHPRVLQAGQAYATRLSNLGRYAEQEAMLRELLPRVGRVWGEDQPRYARFLTWYGKALVGLKRPREAMPPLERALAIYQTAPALDDLGSPNTLQTMAEAALALGQREQALALYERMLERIAERISSVPPDDGTRLLVVATLLIDMGQLDRAAARLKQARERALTRRKPSERIFASIALAQARLERARGRNGSALACVRLASALFAPLAHGADSDEALTLERELAASAAATESVTHLCAQ